MRLVSARVKRHTPKKSDILHLTFKIWLALLGQVKLQSSLLRSFIYFSLTNYRIATIGFLCVSQNMIT
jgi:hypothetical protein